MFNKLPNAIVTLFIIDLGLCAVYLIDVLIGQPYFKITMLLTLGESSVATWYSVVKLFSISVLGSIFAPYRSAKYLAIAVISKKQAIRGIGIDKVAQLSAGACRVERVTR